ncbi:MAG TPA: GreA/GreB family elongation factor, partial [Chthoniobacterales bacterium]|nr:GreA/GreB family elongation factor [Chthoniobacterales bacterium]
RLREELETLRRAEPSDPPRMAELERILASVTVVKPAELPADGVAFGAAVSVRDEAGRVETYRIVGVDELDFEPGAVSWVSPFGRALLAAELGGRVTMEDGAVGSIIRIDRAAD